MTNSRKELQAAAKVLMGQYGNGSERIEKLKGIGLDPANVQNIVNQLIDGTYCTEELESIDTDEFLTVEVDLARYKGMILCLQ